MSKPDFECALIVTVCNPPRVADLTPEIAQLTFFHLQLCVVMGNHDIYICTTPIYSLARREFSTQTIAQNRSQDQKCLLPGGVTESILSISAPNGVFSLFFASRSLSLSLTTVTCWNTIRSWVELLSAHSSLCVVFEDYYAQRHPHWASRQLRGQNP